MLALRHKRAECIGCVACVEHAPDHFEMRDDGLVSLRRCDRVDKQGVEHGRALPHERQELLDAAQACPTRIISVHG